MNAPEKIVNLYLRLNGFFTMPHFTTLYEENNRHTDILAIRTPGSVEKIKDKFVLNIDETFFEKLGKDRDKLICLIAEVKGGFVDKVTRDERGQNIAIDYLMNIFGNYKKNVQIVYFTKEPFDIDEKYYQWRISECYDFIRARFDEAQEISKEIEGLTKAGSWNWSEDFLSVFLYLYGLDKI